jgi:hypothetical protein
MTTAEGKRTCEGLSKIFAPRPNSVLRPATTVLHGGGIALLSASPGIPTPAGRTEIRIETKILKIRTAELQNLEGVERREFFPSPPREHVPTRRPWSRRGREDATLNETASGCGRPYGLSNFRRFAMRRTALGAAFLGTALGCGSLTRRGSTATGYQGGGGASKRPATTSVAQSGLSRSGARSGLEAKAARVADRIRAVELPRSGLVQRDAFAAAAGGPRLRGRPEADPEGMAACGQSLEGFAQMQCSVCLYGSVPSTII